MNKETEKALFPIACASLHLISLLSSIPRHFFPTIQVTTKDFFIKSPYLRMSIANLRDTPRIVVNRYNDSEGIALHQTKVRLRSSLLYEAERSSDQITQRPFPRRIARQLL